MQNDPRMLSGTTIKICSTSKSRTCCRLELQSHVSGDNAANYEQLMLTRGFYFIRKFLPLLSRVSWLFLEGGLVVEQLQKAKSYWLTWNTGNHWEEAFWWPACNLASKLMPMRLKQMAKSIAVNILANTNTTTNRHCSSTSQVCLKGNFKKTIKTPAANTGSSRRKHNNACAQSARFPAACTCKFSQRSGWHN